MCQIALITSLLQRSVTEMAAPTGRDGQNLAQGCQDIAGVCWRLNGKSLLQIPASEFPYRDIKARVQRCLSSVNLVEIGDEVDQRRIQKSLWVRGLWQSRGWLGGDCTSPGEESIPPALKAGSWERNGFMDDHVQGRVREITDAEGL